MLSRALFIGGLIALVAAVPAGAATSPHLTTAGYAALQRLSRVTTDTNVAGKNPVKAIQTACRTVAGPAGDQQARWLERDCLTSAKTYDALARFETCVRAISPDRLDDMPVHSPAADLRRCLTSMITRFTRAVRGGVALEGHLVAQTSGDCRRLFTAEIDDSNAAISALRSLPAALANPGGADKIDEILAKATPSSAQSRREKRLMGACDPA